MNRRLQSPSTLTATLVAVAVGAAVVSGPARAGGLLLYEVGTADVGLASAGYGARAEDASTVLTNPAGMTRLDGTQALFGAQVLIGNIAFTPSPQSSPALGGNGSGNAVPWFPGGGAFVTYSHSPDLKFGFGLAGNFGTSLKYDSDWVGRYYVQEGTILGMSLLPSVAYRVTDKLSVGASLNAMFGYLKDKVAVNNIVGPDGQLELKDTDWGFGANVGVLYEFNSGSRVGLVYTSPVNLDFGGPAEFSGLAPGLATVLRARGLLNANIDLGITNPQTLMLSGFHQIDPRWAVLGSVGWQQWSQFGLVRIGVDSNNPRNLTADLNFKDTWHVALGGQHRLDERWLVNFGIAYDSAFQGSNVSVALPANSAWRFGIGAQYEIDARFSCGGAVEYVYGGTLDVNQRSTAPVAVGGRGNVVGSFENTGIVFVAAYLNWKL